MGKLNPEYEPDGDWLVHTYELESGNRVVIRAKDVRKERTGIHGTVQVMMNQAILASDVFNIERDPERVRLANSAIKLFPDLDRACWPDGHMKHALDVFCLGLWPIVVGQLAVEMMEPNEELKIVKLCGSYIIEGGGTILFAPPGRGKSYTAMAMAVSVDSGCDNLWPVEQRKALYVNLERSRDSMRFRLACINRALGLEVGRPLAFLNARGRSLTDVYDSVRYGIDKHGCDTIILDSISRAGMGDLNENQTGNRTVDLLNRLCPTWIALGHTPRASEDHLFGSVHFDAGMDIGVQLLTQRRDSLLGLGLQVTKANDIAIPPMKVLALEWENDKLATIRTASVSEFPELEAGRKTNKMEEAVDYLLLVGQATAEDVGDAVGMHRSAVSRMFSHSKRIGRTKDGRKVLFFVSEEG